jgi:hypothetical protein
MTPLTFGQPVPVTVATEAPAATRYTAFASTRIAGITVRGDADTISSFALPRTRKAPVAAESGTVTVMRVVPVRLATFAVAPLAKVTQTARSRFVPLIVSACQ